MIDLEYKKLVRIRGLILHKYMVFRNVVSYKVSFIASASEIGSSGPWPPLTMMIGLVRCE